MRRARRLAPFLLMFLCTAAGAAAPPTERKPVTDTLHGVAVSDPYRWLEDGASAEVAAWNEAQGKYARDYLDGLAVRKPIEARLAALIKATSPQFSGLEAAGSADLRHAGDGALGSPGLRHTG